MSKTLKRFLLILIVLIGAILVLPKSEKAGLYDDYFPYEVGNGNNVNWDNSGNTKWYCLEKNISSAGYGTKKVVLFLEYDESKSKYNIKYECDDGNGEGNGEQILGDGEYNKIIQKIAYLAVNDRGENSIYQKDDSTPYNRVTQIALWYMLSIMKSNGTGLGEYFGPKNNTEGIDFFDPTYGHDGSGNHYCIRVSGSSLFEGTITSPSAYQLFRKVRDMDGKFNNSNVEHKNIMMAIYSKDEWQNLICVNLEPGGGNPPPPPGDGDKEPDEPTYVEAPVTIAGKVWVKEQHGDKDINIQKSKSNRYERGDTGLSGVTVELDLNVVRYDISGGTGETRYIYYNCRLNAYDGYDVDEELENTGIRYYLMYEDGEELDAYIYSDDGGETWNINSGEELDHGDHLETREEMVRVRLDTQFDESNVISSQNYSFTERPEHINKTVYTGELGDYKFDPIMLKTYSWEENGEDKQISEYISGGTVTFKYNGVSYKATVAQSYTSNRDGMDVSNAIESGRKSFNEQFETVDLDNDIAANAYGNFSRGKSSINIPNNGEKNGSTAYQMTANTNLNQIGSNTAKVSEKTVRVNLGLLTRQIDVSLSTQLEKVQISVNGKSTLYSYNDILEDKLKTVDLNELVEDNMDTTVPVNVYPSDYYYRIADYKMNTLNKQGEADAAKADKASIDELEVLVRYKVRLFAATAGEDVNINQIAYYYDQNYELVGVEGASSYSELDSSLSKIDGMTRIMVNGNWDVSDDEEYVYFTFKVKQYNNSMYKGNIKGHIATITSYTTDEGLLDIDSAIRNIRNSGNDTNKIITDASEIQFEDDTALAEKVGINLTSEARTISGNVFEDLNKDGNFANDKAINDVIVQLIEITKNNNEYIWQETKVGTNKVGSLVKTDENEFTGLRNYTNSLAENNNGQYEFKDIVPGNYIVRFIYGDGYNYDITVNNTKYNGADYKSTKDTNYKSEWYNTTNYFGTGLSVARDNEARRLEVMSATTEIDAGLGTVLEVYAKNKNSITEMEKVNILNYLNKLKDSNDNEFNASINYLKTLKNNNDSWSTWRNNVLSNISDEDLLVVAKKCIAYKTFMVAETSKINVPLDVKDNNTLRGTSNSTDIGCSGYVYNKIDIKFANVNFGLMAKPQVKLELEKHITALKVTPNGTGVAPIVDARANIADIVKGTGFKATGETKGLKTIKSTRAERGFWDVETDIEELNNGANLEVEYTYVVKNVGDEDYISKILSDLYTSNQSEYSAKLKNLGIGLKNILKGKTNGYGNYLGNYYYTGIKANTDLAVTSRVESLGEALNNQLRYEKEIAGSDFNKVNTTAVAKTIYDRDSNIKTEDIETVIEATKPTSFLERGIVDISKKIKLTKVLASLNSDDNGNIPSYIAEVLKYSSASGGRNIESVPGNLSYVHSEDTERTMETDNERDEFWGETIMIGKPTGEDKILPVQIGIVIATSVAILGVGIVLIRKIVLTK